MATLTLHWASVNDPLNTSSWALVLVAVAAMLMAATGRLLRQVCALLAEMAYAITTASIMILVIVVAIIVVVLTIARV